MRLDSKASKSQKSDPARSIEIAEVNEITWPDRPREGLITVTQEALEDLRRTVRESDQR